MLFAPNDVIFLTFVRLVTDSLLKPFVKRLLEFY